MTPIELIHTLNLNDIPEEVKKQAKLSILDLIGIGAGGQARDCLGLFVNMRRRNLAAQSQCCLMDVPPAHRGPHWQPG